MIALFPHAIFREAALAVSLKTWIGVFGSYAQSVFLCRAGVYGRELAGLLR